jgi:hypothetical protein
MGASPFLVCGIIELGITVNNYRDPSGKATDSNTERVARE